MNSFSWHLWLLSSKQARNYMSRKSEKLWILRKFADSGKKHFRWKRADVLRKPNSFFDLP
jgi:hypothetical protein